MAKWQLREAGKGENDINAITHVSHYDHNTITHDAWHIHAIVLRVIQFVSYTVEYVDIRAPLNREVGARYVLRHVVSAHPIYW